MTEITTPPTPPQAEAIVPPVTHPERTLSAIFEDLDEAQGARPEVEKKYQDHLVRGRLGMAASLFTALRAKHPSTAAHCLRVALGCSGWAKLMGLQELACDELEIAALLHDVGKIGVPDSVILKPGRLEQDEYQLMARHREIGVQILRNCCLSNSLLKIVDLSGAWFDGGRAGYDRDREGIPLGARMIAIVDAFDSMTTEHVYRSALSRERAMSELFECAGSQFDPDLVEEFCRYLSANHIRLEAQVARRWLQDLDERVANTRWELCRSPKASVVHATLDVSIDDQYHTRLLETMHDGVFFVDANGKIVLWNRAIERMSGIKEEAAIGSVFEPNLLKMRDEQDEFIGPEECPVTAALASGVQAFRRLSISGRTEKLQVNLHFSPIVGDNGVSRGATVVVHDASSQITLEERVQTLHVQATMDPLTDVANRSEFDRVHELFISQHLADGMPCSLIICDIDHFKQVNDTYGHQAGDDALVQFAHLLKSHSRMGDLVARYGGEEFVLLCAGCDNASATRRAEEIRSNLEKTPQQTLNNSCMTASFGVTELQAGDTPETMLRRADRGLYEAKEAGRNRVVQLGCGLTEPDTEERRGWFTRLLGGGAKEVAIETKLVTAVPLNVTAEKLKGFVADHSAEIVSVKENQAVLKIDGHNPPRTRRLGDRCVPFLIELKLKEKRLPAGNRSVLQTVIEVTIAPTRKRDRRRQQMAERARNLLSSLKSYFVADEAAE